MKVDLDTLERLLVLGAVSVELHENGSLRGAQFMPTRHPQTPPSAEDEEQVDEYTGYKFSELFDR